MKSLRLMLNIPNGKPVMRLGLPNENNPRPLV
jgi:hypothetical protein